MTMRLIGKAGALLACLACWAGLVPTALAQSAGVAASGSAAPLGLAIEWRLKNPFRFFADPQDLERHREAFAWLTPEERQNPVLSLERRLARHHPMGWATLMKGPTCWDAKHNRHRCPDGRQYLQPTSHVIVVQATGLDDDPGSVCIWRVTTRKDMQPRRTRIRARRKAMRHSGPCLEPVEFEIPYPAGADIVVETVTGRRAETRVRVRDVFIVGIGDSFGSGEGNPDDPVRFSERRAADYGTIDGEVALAGYPARLGNWREIGDERFGRSAAKWLDRACHRSVYAYQLRAALQLALENPQRAVTFAGFACSGAEITEGLFLRYKGNEWVENPPTLSQISAVAQAQCAHRAAPAREYPEAYHMRGQVEALKGLVVLRKCPRGHARKIDLLLVSIGGNDIGFARLVANAVLRDRTMLRRLGGWFGQVFQPSDVEAPMQELSYRYKALNRALHNVLHIPWQESDRVILTAYPGMALLSDGRSVCPDTRLGMDVLPQYRLSAKRALAGERVNERLYQLMRQTAQETGWRIVDAHRRAFLGRGICATGDYFDAADDLRLPRFREGYWQPYNPASYQPYAPRARWFRTPNDAFLTGNFHVKSGLMRRVLRTDRLRWTQLLLASTYSGAFHPTAEGHAAIADAVVRQAREVLRKY
jgi:hypothetical protein